MSTTESSTVASSSRRTGPIIPKAMSAMVFMDLCLLPACHHPPGEDTDSKGYCRVSKQIINGAHPTLSSNLPATAVPFLVE